MAYRYSIVKSIQYGSTSLSSAQTSNTSTITSVNTANAWIQWLGSDDNAASSNTGAMLGQASLTNATTVTCSRSTTDTAAVIIRWVVTELVSDILKSVQEFSIVNIGASTTATLSPAVVVAKTMLVLRGMQSDSRSGPIYQVQAGLTLTNTTTVTGTGGNTVNNMYGVAVEFR